MYICIYEYIFTYIILFFYRLHAAGNAEAQSTESEANAVFPIDGSHLANAPLGARFMHAYIYTYMYVYTTIIIIIIIVIVEVTLVKPSNHHAKCVGDTCLNLTTARGSDFPTRGCQAMESSIFTVA